MGPIYEHERRFLLDHAQARRIVRRAEEHLCEDVHDSHRPFAHVRTTYLDTDDMLLFRSRPAWRVRIREYAAATTPHALPVLRGTSFLELKQSEGSVRWKVRAPVGWQVMRRWLAPGYLDLWSCMASLPELARISLPEKRLFPSLTTWYWRRSFSQAGASVRVTLDERVSFSEPVHPGMPGEISEPTGVVACLAWSVLEVKCFGQVPRWLDESLRGLAEAVGFSKFKAGILAISQGMAPVVTP
ncbi:MAG: polyphosphate polymerase domain-containing protein [Deltaproteobacteria bacterium]|nr:polyphosphate polymerase domain-containing protein [Deltaproteobacteria bacterium]